MKKVAIALAGLVVLVVVGIIFAFGSVKDEPANLDGFAKCLSDKGIVMYGTYWCPHCKNEKDALGESFRFINYVECTERPDECLAKGIEGYPTWILPDGTKLVGEQGIHKLQEASGCPL